MEENCEWISDDAARRDGLEHLAWSAVQSRAGVGKGMDLCDGAGVNQFLLSGLAAEVPLHVTVQLTHVW